MSNEQLYFAVGVPMILNGFMLLAFTASINKRFDDPHGGRPHEEERRAG